MLQAMHEMAIPRWFLWPAAPMIGLALALGACATSLDDSGGRIDAGYSGIVCDGQRIDPRSHDEHCGRCYNSCRGETVCIEGTCRTQGGSCSGAMTECGVECADLLTATSHCGRCFRACAEDQACVDGECLTAVIRDAGANPDAGPTVTDAGGSSPDAGRPPTDAGRPATDAGTMCVGDGYLCQRPGGPTRPMCCAGLSCTRATPDPGDWECEPE